MNWRHVSLLLCVFGFLKDFRPSESFITDYMTGPWKNFTVTEVNQYIFPVSTYSYLVTLVIIFLITDFTRYKPIIILCGLSGSITFLMLILGTSILDMQLLEFFYGLLLSSEVAYYTYIYAKVDKEHYQEVTGHTKVATLIGRFMAGLVGQLTSSFNLLNYHQLNYITLAALSLATIWAFILPSVGQSIYFHRPVPVYNDNIKFSPTTCSTLSPHQISDQYESHQKVPHNLSTQTLSMIYKIRQAYFLLWKHFLVAYCNIHVLKWSLWWAGATCGYLQVINYIQLLWQTAIENDEEIYNGAIDAIYTIISAVAVYCIAKLPLNWAFLGEGTLAVFSFIEGFLLLLASRTCNIWIMYVAYIAFGIIYHTIYTVASFEIAKHISEDSYGLIFGINTLLALILQSLLTFIVINENLVPEIRDQYVVYGGYFIVLGLIFAVIALITISLYVKSGKSIKLILRKEDTKSLTEVETDNGVSSVHTVNAS